MEMSQFISEVLRWTFSLKFGMYHFLTLNFTFSRMVPSEPDCSGVNMLPDHRHCYAIV